MVPRGISLHLGLNSVDPTHYDGWTGDLVACENDAADMAAIAKAQGFTASVLLTGKARSDDVLRAIQDAAEVLRTGDVFLITFAGHGAQIPDQNGDEPNRKDQTWVLHDRMLIDDEVAAAFATFADGVQVVTVLDSCHSGSATRQVAHQSVRTRFVPEVVLNHTLHRNRALYQRLQRNTRQVERIRSTVLLSACQDGEVAADGTNNGLFTATLKTVWSSGHFTGGYDTFCREIDQHMPESQNPGLSITGPDHDAVRAQRPFSITREKEGTMTAVTSADVTENWRDVAEELRKRVPLAQVDEELVFVERPSATDVSRGGTAVRLFWWGFHLELDHATLTKVLDDADTVNSLVGSIGGSIPSPAQPFILVIARFVAGAHALLRTVDQGKGIYLSMSWFAPGIFVPTAVREGRDAEPHATPTRGEPVGEPHEFWVYESSGEVDTGLYIQPGQRVIISASGQIWAGVWFTPTNGPQGWMGWHANNNSPLPGAPPYAMLARLDGRYLYVGAGRDFVYRGRSSKLYLRVNDDVAGNGSDNFQVRVEVYSS